MSFIERKLTDLLGTKSEYGYDYTGYGSDSGYEDHYYRPHATI